MSPSEADLPPIPINDPKRAYEELRDETDRAVLDVLASGHYALGQQVSALEEEFCEYLGTTHAIGVASGTEALLMALQALDVGPDDEVVTTAFSFIGSATCIARLGARPVFVDIDPLTYQMDPAALAEALTPKTRAIIAVHLYGHPAPMQAYLDLAAAGDEPIAVVEDAAQAIGTVCRLGPEPGGAGVSEEPRFAKAGSIGIWGCFSFYPTKNLPACGEAGLMVTPQPFQAERARQIRVHGQDAQYRHVLLGGNGRIDALQAAILSVRLKHLDRWNQQRQENAALYDHLLAQSKLVANELVHLPPSGSEGEVTNYHQYTIRVRDREGRVRDREGLQRSLREKGITTGVYYPIPLPHQPVFSGLGYQQGDFPHSEKAADEVLSLPINQHLSAHEIERVVTGITEYYLR